MKRPSKRDSKASVASDGEALTSHPFAGLSGGAWEQLGAALPAGPAPPAEVAQAPSEPQDAAWLRGKIVVRREKKGRGGKLATVIEGLALPPEGLATLARDLQKALACGGHVEGSAVVLSGAQGERVRAWLQQRGATRVILGS